MSSKVNGLKEIIPKEEYDLIIAEKPNAAKRIAEALKDDYFKVLIFERVQIFIVKRKNKTYVICSASGHLYKITDTYKRREIYPIFDVQWVPNSQKNKMNKSETRIRIIESLSKKARFFINSCDFDLEGETIGHNILKYACGSKEKRALRAKFSTLTDKEIIESIDNAKIIENEKLAEAGRTRHVVDFIWGINLSRALTESYYSSGKGFRTLSIGRVQGPTLLYVIEKEEEIKTFVPTPYWQIIGIFSKNRTQIKALYENEKVKNAEDANNVKKDCEGKPGTIKEVKRTKINQRPPTPFNIGDLQKEAYRHFKINPAQTLRISESLYLNALISYPRTSSQKLPESINYKEILKKLAKQNNYHNISRKILKGKIKPNEGEKEDLAHPSIHPTGEIPRKKLNSQESRIYDLIVKRFFSVFGEDAIIEIATSKIEINKHYFKLLGKRIINEGWIEYYKQYNIIKENSLPEVVEGKRINNKKIEVQRKNEQPPYRYNYSTLLQKMDKESIGTKSTRAEVITTLYKRGYIEGEQIKATEIGFSVIEALRNHSPLIISSEMTRNIEDSLEKIGTLDKHESDVIEETVRSLLTSLKHIKENEQEIGKDIRQAISNSVNDEINLGICPVCNSGNLKIILSKKTKKRFVGCSNYNNGCRASAPIPQEGTIKRLKRICKECKWPIIYTKNKRFSWKLCVNINCPTKEKKNRIKTYIQSGKK